VVDLVEKPQETIVFPNKTLQILPDPKVVHTPLIDHAKRRKKNIWDLW
jgi:hypothetical protein